MQKRKEKKEKMLVLVIVIVVVFLYNHDKKKEAAKAWDAMTYKPENSVPYPRGMGESICEMNYQLFDSFIKRTWLSLL